MLEHSLLFYFSSVLVTSLTPFLSIIPSLLLVSRPWCASSSLIISLSLEVVALYTAIFWDFST